MTTFVDIYNKLAETAGRKFTKSSLGRVAKNLLPYFNTRDNYKLDDVRRFYIWLSKDGECCVRVHWLNGEYSSLIPLLCTIQIKRRRKSNRSRRYRNRRKKS